MAKFIDLTQQGNKSITIAVDRIISMAPITNVGGLHTEIIMDWKIGDSQVALKVVQTIQDIKQRADND